MMKKKFFHSLGPLFGNFLFVVAIWVLHHELRDYHYHDVLLHLAEIPVHRLLPALALTIFLTDNLSLFGKNKRVKGSNNKQSTLSKKPLKALLTRCDLSLSSVTS